MVLKEEVRSFCDAIGTMNRKESRFIKGRKAVELSSFTFAEQYIW